jgi:hypothetical protein
MAWKGKSSGLESARRGMSAWQGAFRVGRACRRGKAGGGVGCAGKSAGLGVVGGGQVRRRERLGMVRLVVRAGESWG